MLYIVPTPLGNLGDVSQRAKDTLAVCDFIIAENPSTTHKLLRLLDIPKKEVVQFADHNEQKVLEKYIARLIDESAALVSDAGTPGISDPGFRLVRACRQQGIEVTAIPGASAAVTALSASGLPTDRFLFVGFLPKTEFKVIELLEMAKTAESTLIGYESPQRIIKTLQYIERKYPTAQAVVARELTKLHEEYVTGTVRDILQKLKDKTSIKGEITLVISLK